MKYLSAEWQDLCQEAVNRDPQFERLAGELSIELNNIVEMCPDGRTRFLCWRFEKGKLVETVVGFLEEMGSRRSLFSTVASYETFMKINTAKMNLETAVMQGLLRFEGDLARMMQHAEALNRFTEVRRAIPTEY